MAEKNCFGGINRNYFKFLDFFLRFSILVEKHCVFVRSPKISNVEPNHFSSGDCLGTTASVNILHCST